MFIHRFMSVVLAINLFSSTALASCERVQPTESFRDQSLLFRTTKGWLDVAQLQSMDVKDGQFVSFAYVIKTSFAKTRKGAVAIKSGFSRNERRKRSQDNVTLYRPAIAATTCSPKYREFKDKYVTTDDYDSYHENGRRNETLKRFHVLYDDGSVNCKETNSDLPDQYALGQRRTNLSQFSFKEQIVRDGYRELALIPFSIRSAFAAENVLEEKRVQIKTYETDDGGLDCVMFEAAVGPGAFVRVNDMERRTLLGGDNKSWDWPLKQSETR